MNPNIIFTLAAFMAASASSIAASFISMPFTNRFETVYIDGKNFNDFNPVYGYVYEAAYTNAGKTLLRVDARHEGEFVVAGGTETIGAYSFSVSRNLTSVVIPNSVTSIMNDAFAHCSSLTNVVFGNGLREIGESAFYKCEKLERVELPDSLITIGRGAFVYCPLNEGIIFGKGIKHLGRGALGAGREAPFEFTVPESITSLGDSALSGLQMSSVIIHSSVTNIGDSVFYGCRYLTNIVVAADNPRYFVENGVLYDRLRNALVVIPAGYNGTHFDVPDWVAEIDNNAFFETKITAVSLPPSVKKTGEWAFVNYNSTRTVSSCDAVKATISPSNRWIRVEDGRVVPVKQ